MTRSVTQSIIRSVQDLGVTSFLFKVNRGICEITHDFTRLRSSLGGFSSHDSPEMSADGGSRCPSPDVPRRSPPRGTREASELARGGPRLSQGAPMSWAGLSTMRPQPYVLGPPRTSQDSSFLLPRKPPPSSWTC